MRHRALQCRPYPEHYGGTGRLRQPINAPQKLAITFVHPLEANGEVAALHRRSRYTPPRHRLQDSPSTNTKAQRANNETSVNNKVQGKAEETGSHPPQPPTA